MADSIDYYFTSASPFAYMGHDLLLAIGDKHGKKINFKPFNIAKVWNESGSVPLGERSPVRQRYRLIELQRISRFRNVVLNTRPRFFPTDITLADLCICALVLDGENPASFARAVGEAIWKDEKQVADEETLLELLSATGHDGNPVLAAAQGAEAAALRDENTAAAIEHDAIGAPAYLYMGEVFWGQDRLEYLEEMISSGRDAFTSEV